MKTLRKSTRSNAKSRALRNVKANGSAAGARIDGILSAREGYDRAAQSFDSWEWCAFWQRNEAPLVHKWIASLQTGLGLDAGCGTGSYTRMIAAAGHRSVAVDLSGSMLTMLRLKHVDAVEIVQTDIQLLPFCSNQFDWVLCTRVLSHISDVAAVMAELARVLRPNGRVLISDVHPLHPYTRTTVDTLTGIVPIRTYKHQLSQLSAIAGNHCAFDTLDLREHKSHDLTWQPHGRPFDKLFKHANTSVFYTLELRLR
jgi:SAM-dependent methyltransferase